MKIQDLKNEELGKALVNTLDYYGDSITIRKALEMPLDKSFDWEASREGLIYWINIYNKYNK